MFELGRVIMQRVNKRLPTPMIKPKIDNFTITNNLASTFLDYIEFIFQITPYEEKIWYGMQVLPLKTLLLSKSAHCWNISQHNFKLEAWLRQIRDLIPKPPSSKPTQTFFQATVTNFLFDISPLHMKFLIHFSISLRRLVGQEKTDILELIKQFKT